MIVLDTNVISELMRPAPNTEVVAWVDEWPAEELGRRVAASAVSTRRRSSSEIAPNFASSWPSKTRVSPSYRHSSGYRHWKTSFRVWALRP